MTIDLLSDASVPKAEEVAGIKSPWDKARAARAVLGGYRERRKELYDELTHLDDSIAALETAYRKLVDAAVDNELSLAKGK